VLTNTVWMKADWLRQFNPLMTRPGDFFAAGGRAVRVSFMHQQEPFRHLDSPGFQAIELPYRGEELAMVVFLPKARDGLPAFERELDPAQLERWIGQLRAAEPEPVDLALPKIRLETRYQLARTLQEMGMPLAFGQGADFSGIDGRRGLFIAKAIHQTFLQVDEKGTEAAAATALVMNESGPRPARIRFLADRPFFFLIRDNRSGAVLFMGRIEEPPPG
jgi:serpin B